MRRLQLRQEYMNDNLDDFLNSLGFDSDTTQAITQEQVHFHMPDGVISVPVMHEEASTDVAASSLTESDFDDILQDNGFNEPLYQDAEEVHDGEDDETDWEEREEEEEDTNDEGRDLDAEEDAEWEDRIASGEIREASDWETGVIRDADIATAVASSQANVARRRDRATVSSESSEGSDTPDEPLLPLNSPTLLMDEATSRFSGTEWFNEIQKARIIVAGIGGIGSNLVFQLARMNPAVLFMYDDDHVETANMSGQLYARADVDKTKVGAMYDMIQAYTNMQNIYAIPQRFTPTSEAGDIMICGFDNMEARKTFFDSWCTHIANKTPEEKKKCLFLDGRLSIDTLQIFAFTGDDGYNILNYQENYLFSDADADATVCSMKQTTYLACMIGSLMTNLFTNFIANSLDPIIPYDLPFFTEYDAQNMIFKTIK